MDRDAHAPERADGDRDLDDRDRHLVGEDRRDAGDDGRDADECGGHVAADALEPLLDVLAEIAIETLYDGPKEHP